MAICAFFQNMTDIVEFTRWVFYFNISQNIRYMKTCLIQMSVIKQMIRDRKLHLRELEAKLWKVTTLAPKAIAYIYNEMD